MTNSLKDGSANLNGKNLILEGGSSDIGATDKPIDVDLTGSLSALTDGSMYISSVGNHNLQLSGLYAGKDMVLASKKDIAMSPDASAQAYLNAGRLLDLKAEGGIGAKDSAYASWEMARPSMLKRKMAIFTWPARGRPGNRTVFSCSAR